MDLEQCKYHCQNQREGGGEGNVTFVFTPRVAGKEENFECLHFEFIK